MPTDKEGRFTLTGIVPGMKYSASVTATRKLGTEMMPMGIGKAFDDVAVEAGEVKDLGDLKLKTGRPDEDEKEVSRAEKKSAETSPVSLTKTKPVDNAAAKSDEANTIRAVIKLPDGSPADKTHVALTGLSEDYSKSIVLGTLSLIHI